MKRPTREQLAGYSLSEFKTLLKHLGHKVPRNLTHAGYITQYGNHYFRWRFWSDEGFVVDRSVPTWDFDRWGNSVEETYSFKVERQKSVGKRLMDKYSGALSDLAK